MARTMSPRYTEDTLFADVLVARAMAEGLRVHSKYACDVRQGSAVVASVALANEKESGEYFAIATNAEDFECFALFTECPKEARELFVHKALEVSRDTSRW